MLHQSHRTFIAVTGLLAMSGTAALAHETAASGPMHVRGTIRSFDGRHRMEVRDRSGAVSVVRLRTGTVIMPKGITLRKGMRVAVAGKPGRNGSTIDALEVDAPYHAVRVAVGPGYSPFQGYTYDEGTPTSRRVWVPNTP